MLQTHAHATGLVLFLPPLGATVIGRVCWLLLEKTYEAKQKKSVKSRVFLDFQKKRKNVFSNAVLASSNFVRSQHHSTWRQAEVALYKQFIVTGSLFFR